MISGGAQGLIAAAIVLPIASVVHAAGVEAHINLHWLLILTLVPLSCICMASLGLLLGTSFEPRNLGLMFGFIVLPITFLGGTYYQWTRLAPVKAGRVHWLQIIVLINPLIYINDGMRAAFTNAAHMHLYVIYPGHRGLQRDLPRPSGSRTSDARSSLTLELRPSPGRPLDQRASRHSTRSASGSARSARVKARRTARSPTRARANSTHTPRLTSTAAGRRVWHAETRHAAPDVVAVHDHLEDPCRQVLTERHLPARYPDDRDRHGWKTIRAEHGHQLVARRRARGRDDRRTRLRRMPLLRSAAMPKRIVVLGPSPTRLSAEELPHRHPS